MSLTDVILLGTGVVGTASGIAGLIYVQRNRKQDQVDKDTVLQASERSSDTRAALNAWQQIVAAHASQIVTLQDRCDACDLREASQREQIIAKDSQIEEQRVQIETQQRQIEAQHLQIENLQAKLEKASGQS